MTSNADIERNYKGKLPPNFSVVLYDHQCVQCIKRHMKLPYFPHKRSLYCILLHIITN